MDNLHLFELINAAPGLAPWRLAVARAVAVLPIYLLPVWGIVAWVRGGAAARREVLRVLLVVVVALALAEAVEWVWPQPQPFALHVGTQYLAHGTGPGLPSEPTAVFWSVALAALSTRHFAVLAFPLMAAGLLVGLSRVYLGVHFPFDVLAALPVAAVAALLGGATRRIVDPRLARVVELYDLAWARLRTMWR